MMRRAFTYIAGFLWNLVACRQNQTSASNHRDGGASDLDGCVMNHKRGSKPVADLAVTETELASCRGDSGSCQASTPSS
jgi:hypothetical protein